jgi:hypothetical protein
MSKSVLPESLELNDVEKGLRLGTSLDIYLNKSITKIPEKENRFNIDNSVNSVNRDTNNSKGNIMFCCIFTCILIFMLPMIICDLYYGFSNDACLLEHPETFNFKLKTYLLVCGFIGIINITIYIISWYASFYLNNSELLILMVSGIGLSTISELFYIVWNIIGSILFWSYIYNLNKCNSELSTYLIVSLIIKTILSFSLLCKRKNEDD